MEQQIWYVCEDCGCRVPQSGMTKVKLGPDFVFINLIKKGEVK